MPTELGSKAREMYSQLSLAAHPRDDGLALLFHYDADTTFFHVGGYFNRGLLQACLYFAIAVGQTLFAQVEWLHREAIGDPDSEWVRNGATISEQAAQFVDRVHVEIGAVTSAHASPNET